MKINKYHPMGDIYLFKMLILLIKMHIYALNQNSKGYKGKVALSQNEWVIDNPRL